jgi:hypothetical protein
MLPGEIKQFCFQTPPLQIPGSASVDRNSIYEIQGLSRTARRCAGRAISQRVRYGDFVLITFFTFYFFYFYQECLENLFFFGTLRPWQ